MTGTTLGEVLIPRESTEWVGNPGNETFVTVRMRALGAVPRSIGEGKTPRPFRGSRVAAGDLIYSRIDARNGAFAMVPDSLGGAVVSKDFPTFGLRADRVEASYLSHLVRAPAFWARFQAMSFGATNRQRIDERLLLAQRVYLPPLPEQRRIASILDEADALRAHCAVQHARLAEVLSASFEAAAHASSGRTIVVSDLIESSQYGTSAKAGSTGRLPILRMGNVTSDGRIDLTDMKYIDLSPGDEAKYTVRQGDLLFNRTNSADLVGKSAVYRETEPRAFAGYLVRLRPKSPELGEYVAGYLNSRHGKLTLRKMAKSIVGMANINAREAMSIRLPEPDAERLDAFMRVRDQFEAQAASMRSRIEQLDALFASLQHLAFRGEL